jgi:hypothetical protein
MAQKPQVFAGKSVPLAPHGIYTLTKSIAALPVLSTQHVRPSRFGLTQLPEGAEIEVSGPGFGDGTVTVRTYGATFFVFVDDLGQFSRRGSTGRASTDYDASAATAGIGVGANEPSAHHNEPGLFDLIKTKFFGYFRWTAFAMLLAPVVFWIASRQ